MAIRSIIPQSENRVTYRCIHAYLFVGGLLFGILVTHIFVDMKETMFQAYNEVQRKEGRKLHVKTTQNKSLEYPHLIENSTIADRLFDEVRITCFVLTSPEAIEPQAKATHRNWGHRCNKLVYISSEPDNRLENIVAVHGKFGEWQQTKNALTYLHEHYGNNTDYFVRTDHTSFIIPENLRYMVYPYQPEMPLFFGGNYKLFPAQSTISTLDYVLSRAAVRLMIENGFNRLRPCMGTNTSPADVEIYNCLEALAVVEGNSLDAKGSERFLTFAKFELKLPEEAPYGTLPALYFRKYLFAQTMMLDQDCSAFPVSFRSLRPEQMAALNCLINTIQPYGIVDKYEALPPKHSRRHLASLPSLTVSFNDSR